ncbi:hypothetical protein DMN91_011522 [Ooceraea biroi]|uniref:Uncharacterized protein n=2 Tax=Ooceraea biroi TaxID=2015173 RepID=A0A3L8D6A4_OOCBI|nr:hypothetical protein DMN91_011522 [Ooceraea biroi]
MKWKSSPCKFISEKTFLVIKDDLEIPKGKDSTRTSASGRRTKAKDAASTGTWPPPKMKRVQAFCEEQPERPKTASLERPSVLDPTLVDKLDMSLLSKELLRDSITHFHRSASKPVGGGTATSSSSLSSSSSSLSLSSPLSLLPSPTLLAQPLARRAATTTITSTTWSSHDDVPVRRQRQFFEQIYAQQIARRMEEVDRSRSPGRGEKTSPGAATHDHAAATKRSPDVRKLDDNNNRNGPPKLSTVKKKNSRVGLSTDLEIFTTASAKNLAPEPCKTCGRPDQPERFHSHPKGSQKIKDIPTTTATVKKLKTIVPPVPKSIQKPVALNFRSDRNKNRPEDIEARSKPVTPQDRQDSAEVRASSAPNKRGPKTITCYVCGREFGTASFPIHEPRCLEKWERENNSLPAAQRRPRPQRPTVGTEHSDWNAAAWEQSQEQLVPCAKCGRTFLPERLPVHERSCKATPKNNDPRIERMSASATTRNAMPPTVPCQICGRKFGSRSIKIHEPQCNRRWLAQNNSASPQKSHSAVYENSQESSMYPDLTQKKTVTCYICGRDFGTSSIAIHEPQCLKKWHIQNDKLSPARRRKEPQKPEVIYTQDHQGNMIVDQAATTEANWVSHLSQLVPCKSCGRTFNPDRVNIHEKSCKGTR